MNIKDFERTQETIRKDLLKVVADGEVVKAIKLIETFSEVTLRLNNIKSDDLIERSLKELSSKYIGELPVTNLRNNNLIVFYDQIGTTVCLGLQYLRGIIAAGYDVVYVYENYRTEISPLLLKEVKAMGIQYKLFGPSTALLSNNHFGGKIISEYINSLNPGKILVHPSPSDAIGPIVMYSLPHIEKFFVVPGDHHYYAGLHSADFLIEFRKFGIGISVNERGIKREKIYKLPYYPIIDALTPFQGYPVDCVNKIVFVTAGATYKFIGSPIIYVIWEYVLKKDNTLILFMGKADKQIRKFIIKHNLQNRFILLGYRKDFNQCVKNADVLINSYPVGGALVCQTAASFGKPIIAYCDEKEYLFQNVDDIFGSDGSNDRLSKTSLEELKQYIDRLIEDRDYRVEKGETTKKALQTREAFEKTLSLILEHKVEKIKDDDLMAYDREFIFSLYLKQQNQWHPTVFVPLILQYGFSFFWKFRFMFREIVKNPLYVGKFLLLYVMVKTKLR